MAKSAQQGRPAIKSWDERVTDLMGFKQKFGHCNVPQRRYDEYQSLGSWCKTLRTAYNKIQQGETPRLKLTEENIRQLEDAGFKWSLSPCRTFDELYAELMKYKEKSGHCNVPKSNSGEYQSLGNWCNTVRTAYKKIQQGETPQTKLTQEMIQQLEDAGFMWSVSTSPYRTFDEWYAELMKYKDKSGHCNAPRTQSGDGEYTSLGKWCGKLRTAYKKIQNRETPRSKLTEEHIRQLEDAGFQWSHCSKRVT